MPNVATLISSNEAAVLDHESTGKNPAYRYITLANIPNNESDHWDNTLRFTVCSHSTAKVIESHVPVLVSKDHRLYRIDLTKLGWTEWDSIIKRYPYSDVRTPLIVRGDWLCDEIWDYSESDAGPRLLYGNKPPRTKAEFVEFWKLKSAEPYGLVEGKSRVAVNKTRWIQHFDRFGGSAWGTRDFLDIRQINDPLEQLTGNFLHDGEEIIVQFRKVSSKDHTRGTLQAYGLFDAKFATITDASTKLVEDYQRYKNRSSIRNAGSCVGCHETGINGYSENALVKALADGVQLDAIKDTYDEISEFHLTDTQVQIERDRADYAIAIMAINGCSPEANAESFRWSWRWYIQDVDLKQAAKEQSCKPEELRNAIAWASAKKLEIGVRLSLLAQDQTIYRSSWEDLFVGTRSLLIDWRKDVK